MTAISRLAAFAAMAVLVQPVPALAQMQNNPAGTEAQRQAIAALDYLDGEWRGTVVTSGPGGSETLTQTERVGSMLGGSVKVIEGRGYAADGTTAFNAMAVVSWNTARNAYGMRSYAQGYQGDYPFAATPDGFIWETPAGPGAVIKYVAVVRDGHWHEVGDYVAEGQPPRRFIEMRLDRIGDTDWPASGAVDPTP